ncbi:PcfJ domain-containing protein [Floccifex sp.]|uniref:PcfJ domain-containing protein n=1 Tax=Floccifex sp. TaxID=2815810 RepID=UPI003F06ACCE
MGTNKSVLEKLRRKKLPYPVGIEKFIIMQMDERMFTNAIKRSYFVDTLCMVEGRIVQRIFAFKFNFINDKSNPHKMDFYVQEVYRRVEGEKKALIGDVYASYCGKEVEYHEGNSHFDPCDDTYHFYPFHFYDKKEWIKFLDIPYCQYFNPKNESGLSFYEYICLYRKYPKIELLVKADLSHFISHIHYLDTSQKYLEDIFKVDKKFVPMLKDMNFQNLMHCRKYPWVETFDELRKIDMIYYLHLNNIKKYLNRKMMDYMENHRLEHGLYDDYLGFCEKLKANMKSNKILYPEELHSAHDEAAKQIKIIKDEVTKIGFKLNYEEHQKLIYHDDGFMIRPVYDPDELVVESEKLHHCVRTYTDRVATCETEIMFVRKENEPEEPLYTLELKGKRIIQFRADHNKEPEKEAIDFINKWAVKNKLENTY